MNGRYDHQIKEKIVNVLFFGGIRAKAIVQDYIADQGRGLERRKRKKIFCLPDSSVH